MMPPEAAALFDQFTTSAVRVEALPVYLVDDELDELDGWRAGRPRPEYSVRTSPWLARIALDTLAGKRWSRIRIVEQPLTDYVRWQLINYVEAAATGEEIRIVDRGAHPQLGRPAGDFWLFDQETDHPVAIALAYDADGRPGEHQVVTDPAQLRALAAVTAAAGQASVSLNEFLAGLKPALPLTA